MNRVLEIKNEAAKLTDILENKRNIQVQQSNFKTMPYREY